jgi:hypothetical protein
MSAVAISPADLYRRQARRLRHELRDNPIKLHQSLAALSTSRPVWKRETRTDHVKDLIAATVDHMEGPILRYPARIALLKQAQRVGLAHFDANLIITAVQHRMGERLAPRVRIDRPWVRTLAIVVIFQAWILAGIYWLIS